jgi:exodeoxyribonuclease VIII
MLENAYNAVNLSPPWKFYNVNDCRTIERLARRRTGMTRRMFPRTGTHHNALDDAKYQAHYISKMYQAIMSVQRNG